MATRSLGVLTLDLVAKIGGFTAGMDQASRVTDKRMREIEKRAYKMGDNIGRALKAAGAASLTFAGLYIKNTIEAEKVQAQLVARINDTAGAAGRSLQELNAQAAKLQATTVFDDESIGSAQAMLLTFKQIQGVNFDKAVDTATDLATVMGTDITDAAKLLGKALNDPERGLTALSKAGVTFTDDQRKVIKAMVDAGDTAGAQKLILEQLSGTMGTAAEAARNTLGGSFKALKNTVDNLLEGDTSQGGLKGTRQAIEDLNSALQDPGLKSGIDATASAMLNLATVAAQVIEAFAISAKRIGIFVAEMVNQAGIAADVYRQIRTFGLADGTIAADLQKQRQGYATFVDADKELIASSHKMQQEAQKVGKIKPIIITADSGQIPDSAFRPKAAPPPKPPHHGGARAPTHALGGSGTSDAQRQAQDAARAAQEATEAQQGWHDSVLDMMATLQGPAAEAQREYDKQISQLNDDFAKGKVTLADYAKATELYAGQRDKAVDAIKAQKTQTDDLIESLKGEIALMGANEEGQRHLIAARMAGKDATSEQIAEIETLNSTLDAMRDQQRVADDLKASLSDAFVDFIDGAKSAKEAFGDFADHIYQTALRFLADKAVQALFSWGQNSGGGASGGGGGGGFNWASLIGAFVGGGRASGGPVSPGKFYEVGEYNRPEMLMSGGKQYLIPGNAGAVTPVGSGAGQRRGGNTIIQNFSMSRRNDNRSERQVAQATGRAIRMA